MQKTQEMQVDPCIGKIHWHRKWQPTLVFLPGKFHRQRSLAGYSLWCCTELDTAEGTHTPLRAFYERLYVMGLEKYLHWVSWITDTIFILFHILKYWRRKWHPTPVLLPGESHARRSLVGCSPWGRKESDTTKQLTPTCTCLNISWETHPTSSPFSETKVVAGCVDGFTGIPFQYENCLCVHQISFRSFKPLTGLWTLWESDDNDRSLYIWSGHTFLWKVPLEVPVGSVGILGVGSAPSSQAAWPTRVDAPGYCAQPSCCAQLPL